MKRGYRAYITGWRLLWLPAVMLLAGLLSVPASAAEDAERTHWNYLLIGQDEMEDGECTRSDSMILCSFNCRTKQVVLLSFLRDLYVPIPGHGSNRLNAAYAFGGAPLLRQTVEENFGVTVDGCIEVDFARFSQIMDQLGGVELELRADEAALISRETGTLIQPGRQKLTGDQALVYARIRSLDTDGDFSRTQRQRTVLTQVWNTYKNCSLPKLIRVMGSLIPMLRTDIASGELLRAMVDIFPYITRIEVTGYSVPAAEQCRDVRINGMAVLTADMDAVRSTVKSLLSAAPEQEK